MDISAPHQNNVIIYASHGGDNQRFKFKQIKNNKYSFSSKNINKPITVLY